MLAAMIWLCGVANAGEAEGKALFAILKSVAIARQDVGTIEERAG